MMAIGLVGFMSVMGFVSWVMFREPWVRSHGDPGGPNAQAHAEEVRQQRRFVTRRALDRLRDARDGLEAVARADARGSYVRQ